jgi:hypothetical protein
MDSFDDVEAGYELDAACGAGSGCAAARARMKAPTKEKGDSDFDLSERVEFEGRR